MKILFLTNLLPYPLDNGGKIKTFTTIKALSNAHHSIHLVCFTEGDNVSEQNPLDNLCEEIKEIPLKLTTSLNKKYMVKIAFKSLFSNYSFGILKYWSKDMANYLKRLKDIELFDCVYIDHLQLYLYKEMIKHYWPNAKIILDEHNCEYMIMERNCKNSSTLFMRLFLLLETKKLKRFESKATASVDKLIVLSEEDLNMLRKITRESLMATIIPIGMRKPNCELQSNFKDLIEPNILFIGTLSWAPNNDGLVWFLEKVMPILQKEYDKFSLYIVGKNPGEYLKKIANQYENVKITGYVDAVLPYYEKCDFMVVPLFVGSGQRVKIIEAFSYGIPVISTSVGAEGLQYIENENILIANNEREFLNQCKIIKNGELRRKISHNSKENFNRFYSLDAVEKQICAVVDSL